MPKWQRPAQREGERECGDDQNDQFENWLYTVEEEKKGRREKACTRSWSGGSAPVFQVSEGVDGSRGGCNKDRPVFRSSPCRQGFS